MWRESDNHSISIPHISNIYINPMMSEKCLSDNDVLHLAEWIYLSFSKDYYDSEKFKFFRCASFINALNIHRGSLFLLLKSLWGHPHEPEKSKCAFSYLSSLLLCLGHWIFCTAAIYKFGLTSKPEMKLIKHKNLLKALLLAIFNAWAFMRKPVKS